MYNKSLTALLATSLLLSCIEPTETPAPPTANTAPTSIILTNGNTLVANSTDDADSSELEYNWQINGTTVSFDKELDTTLLNYTGDQTIVLITTDAEGLSDSINIPFNFGETSNPGNTNPQAVASASVTSGTAPLSVSFNGSQSSDAEDSTVDYFWDFGNGLTSTLANPIQQFAAGTHSVTLTVTDSQGASDTTDLTIFSNAPGVDADPVASFEVNTSTGTAPLAITFDASSSDDDDAISIYSWDFGDNSALSFGIVTSHTYQTAGTYDAVLTVTDSAEQTDTFSRQIIVTIDDTTPTNAAPTANFIITKDGLTLNVDASTSSDPEMLAMTYAWEFYDASNSIVHTDDSITSSFDYAAAGNVSVKLTVSDSIMQTDEITHTATVSEPVGGNGTIIFEEDYESQTVGQNPSGWGTNVGYFYNNNPGSTQYADKIKVVSDITHSGSKALWVNGNNLASNQNYSTYDLPANTDRLFLRFYYYSVEKMGARNKDQFNHNHFLALGDGPSKEVRIGEMKGYMLGVNDYPSDALVPKADLWGTGPELDANTWHCVEVAFLNDGPASELSTWLNGDLITHITSGSDFHVPQPDNWLDEKMTRVQLGWANFGTYDNDVYFDDIIASDERIGCDGSSGGNTPDPVTFNPMFDLSQDSMVVTADSSGSTASESFTYSWDFNGEHTSTDANPSYAFSTAGDKTVSLTLVSGSETSTVLTKTINVLEVVDSTYDDLLANIATNVVTATCNDCHDGNSNKPIKFGNGTAADVEAGIITYIEVDQATNADKVKYLPSNTSPYTHNPGDKLGANKQDWEDLIDMIVANLDGNNGGGSGFTGLASAFINDDFEGQTDGQIPSGWKSFIGYNGNSMNTSTSQEHTVIDSTKAYTGSSSVKIKSNSSYDPVFFYKEMEQGKNAYYVRSWVYLPISLGGSTGTISDSEHTHIMAFSTEMSGSNKQELRFGTSKKDVLSAFLPSGYDGGTAGVRPDTIIPGEQWVCIEFAMIKNDNIDQTMAWYNDELIFEITEAQHWEKGNPGQFLSDAGAGSDNLTSFISLGWRKFGSFYTINEMWFDDVVVSDERIGCN